MTMIVVDGDGHETVRSHLMDEERLYQSGIQNGDCEHKGGLRAVSRTTKPRYDSDEQ